jgi:uncharacterized protein
MNENRKFEWDENKRRSNIQKHGIDFGDAKDAFDDPAAYTLSSPRSTGERRYVTVGLAKGLLIAVISTLRGSVVRIISARAASRTERQAYGSENPKEQR